MSTGTCEAQTGNASAAEKTRLERFGSRLLQPKIFLRLSAALLFLLYIRTINFDFVYDDLGLVLFEWKGWGALGKLFLHDIFATAEGPGSSYYRPLASVYAAVMNHWTGVVPGWFHLAAIAIHLTVFGLAYGVGRHLFKSEKMALVTALLFALHPTKVEAVAWIGASGCDGLGAIFFFGSLLCYFKWRDREGSFWLPGSVALYAACLLTKETLAVLPGIMAVHYWLSENRQERIRKTVLLMVPFCVVLAGYFVLRHIALTPHVVQAGVAKPYLKPSFNLTSVWSAPLAWWWYVKHLVWPTGLAVMYDSIVVSAPTFRNFVLPGLAAGVLLVVGVWQWLRRASIQVTTMAVFFVLTLAPYIVLAPMAQQHDRYLYLATYPFAALLAWLLLNLKRISSQARFAVGALLILLWAASAWHESGFWQTDFSMWQRAVAVAPNLVRPPVMAADHYLQDGNATAASHVVDNALRRNPTSPMLLHAKGAILKYQGDLAGAKRAFEEAFAADSLGNLKPICAFKAGDVAMQQQDYAGAAKWFRTATELAPRTVGYHGALARALRAQGRIAEAEGQEKAEREIETYIRDTANSL